MRPGPHGNDIIRTNVPNIRLCYREATLKDEFQFLERCVKQQQTQLSARTTDPETAAKLEENALRKAVIDRFYASREAPFPPFL